MQEVLEYHKNDILNSKILETLKLKENDFFIVSTHREENVDSEENFNDLLDSLNAIAEKYQKRVIVSTHPRTRKKLELLDNKDFNPLIEFMKPLGFFDYIALQQNAYCAISDSGTITEESSILRFPAITIRQAHERPEGMDEGTLIMSGLKSEDILNAIDVVTEQSKEQNMNIVKDYETNTVSKKVVRIILSYIDYINRTVWKKY